MGEEPTEIRAPPGIVSIELPEDPTTGYLWDLADPPLEVREVEREYQQGAEGPIAGGTGARTFRVEVNDPGVYELEFHLRRPWEATVRERRNVTLIVEPVAPC